MNTDWFRGCIDRTEEFLIKTKSIKDISVSDTKECNSSFVILEDVCGNEVAINKDHITHIEGERVADSTGFHIYTTSSKSVFVVKYTLEELLDLIKE